MNVGFARELMRRSVRNGEPGLLVGSRPATPLVFGGSNMSYADRARPALASMLMVLAIAGLAVLSVWPTTADAAVEGIEILAREPVAGGAVFGAAGIYEKIRGRASFAVDPATPTNAAIADLALAPRDAQGLVHFSADFLMLRPAEAARGNGTLIYEVNNRGTLPMLVQLNEAPATNDRRGSLRVPRQFPEHHRAIYRHSRLALSVRTGGGTRREAHGSGATREQTTGGFPHSLEIRAVARWWTAATATAGGRIPTGAPLRTHLHCS